MEFPHNFIILILLLTLLKIKLEICDLICHFKAHDFIVRIYFQGKKDS